MSIANRKSSKGSKEVKEHSLEDVPVDHRLTQKIMSIDKIAKKDDRDNLHPNPKTIQLSRKAKRKLQKLKSSAYLAPEEPLDRVSTAKSNLLERDSLLSTGSGFVEKQQQQQRQILRLRSEHEGFYGHDPNVNDLQMVMLDLDEEMFQEDDIQEQAKVEDASSTDSEGDIEYERYQLEKFNENLQQLAQPTQRDIIEELGRMPSLDKLSEDLSELLDDKEIVPVVSITGDIGKFVDPLTGVDIISEKSSESSELSVPVQPAESEFTMEPQESNIDLLGELPLEEDEDLGGVPKYEEDEEKGRADEDINFGAWIKETTKHINITDEVSQNVYDDYMRQMALYINEYLNELLLTVVHSVEYSDPGRALRKALDKKKLMEELDAKTKELDIEKKTNLLLNKAVTDFYRRKGSVRALKADNPEELPQLMEKQLELHNKLFQALEREEELKNIAALRISNIRQEITAAEAIANQSVDSFEHIIKKTFLRERFQYLNEIVLRAMKQMSNTRATISTYRTSLLQKQHTLAKLKEKEDNLEDIGNGLTIRQFEHLQAETTTLDQKLYERELELNQCHISRNKKLHTMTHQMEYHIMLQDTLTIQEHFLNDLLDEKLKAREDLNRQKMVRTQLREEMKSIQHQGGLAGNALLMLDYDKTLVVLEATKERIAILKRQQKQLETRYSRLESRYSSVPNIKMPN